MQRYRETVAPNAEVELRERKVDRHHLARINVASARVEMEGVGTEHIVAQAIADKDTDGQLW
jgi:hypothetical protein